MASMMGLAGPALPRLVLQWKRAGLVRRELAGKVSVELAEEHGPFTIETVALAAVEPASERHLLVAGARFVEVRGRAVSAVGAQSLVHVYRVLRDGESAEDAFRAVLKPYVVAES